MSTAVLTAITDRYEGRVVSALERTRLDVVRRCADLPDLLAAAGARLGEVAFVSADLRGLDRTAVEQLRAHRVRVVGVHPPDDEAAERILRQLGVTTVVVADATGEDLEAAADEPAAEEPAADRGPRAWGEDGVSGPDPHDPDLPEPGRVVAVWGPAGAPGRTTVAVNLAAELAGLGRTVLLVDADTYGGSVAQHLSLLDEAPGLAAATRAADQGHLDLAALSRLAPQVGPGLRVLTGLPRAERWPEVSAPALEHVLTLARRLAQVVVVDCGFCLEDDEELSYDTLAPRRNAATLTSLSAADRVVAVGAGDPVGLQRLVRGLQELAATPAAEPLVVVTKVRAGAAGARPQDRIAEALRRFAGVAEVRFVPDDREALDAALLAGRTLAESDPQGRARRAVLDLAAELAETQPLSRRRRRLLRR